MICAWQLALQTKGRLHIVPATRGLLPKTVTPQ